MCPSSILVYNTPTLGSRLAVHEGCGKSYCGACTGPRVLKESALARPVVLGLSSCGLKRSGRFKRSRYNLGQPQHQTNCACFNAEARGAMHCSKGRRPCALLVTEGPAISFIDHSSSHHVHGRWWCFRLNSHSAAFETYRCPGSTIMRRGRRQSQERGTGTLAAAVFGHSLSARERRLLFLFHAL